MATKKPDVAPAADKQAAKVTKASDPAKVAAMATRVAAKFAKDGKKDKAGKAITAAAVESALKRVKLTVRRG